ncbi:hypothetical protein [Palleronia abyssalis]|uniref:DUF4189 domain-containing protein n=1 Tax=Palleronia abyssalis TaxID=1501240 RepID=A0A2R8BUT4_9RHOB|nr:hypothetical protein [Palleronia abyssalis]SPJ23900.1 hypothetical protein PAA8504_01720 [Palleronia abyssalis]
MRILFSILIVAVSGPASAQSIAFAQAVEQSWGIGTGATIEDATQAARSNCVAEGGFPEDCIVTTACEIAGHSVDVFLQHREGPHWHETHCGLPDRATAEAVGETLCDGSLRPYLIECMVSQIWSPDGTPLIEW